MFVAPTSTPGLASGQQKARTPEEAAVQFEAVLVRQMVQTMTKELFKSSGGPGGQAELQRDTLVDALTSSLVNTDALRLRDLLLRQWGAEPAPPEAFGEAPMRPLSSRGEPGTAVGYGDGRPYGQSQGYGPGGSPYGPGSTLFTPSAGRGGEGVRPAPARSAPSGVTRDVGGAFRAHEEDYTGGDG